MSESLLLARVPLPDKEVTPDDDSDFDSSLSEDDSAQPKEFDFRIGRNCQFVCGFGKGCKKTFKSFAKTKAHWDKMHQPESRISKTKNNCSQKQQSQRKSVKSTAPASARNGRTLRKRPRMSLREASSDDDNYENNPLDIEDSPQDYDDDYDNDGDNSFSIVDGDCHVGIDIKKERFEYLNEGNNILYSC